MAPPLCVVVAAKWFAAYYLFIDPERMKGWVGLNGTCKVRNEALVTAYRSEKILKIKKKTCSTFYVLFTGTLTDVEKPAAPRCVRLDTGWIFHFFNMERERHYIGLLGKLLMNVHEIFGRSGPSDKKHSVRFWDWSGYRITFSLFHHWQIGSFSH